MAKPAHRNGSRLEEAVATLINTQASIQSNMLAMEQGAAALRKEIRDIEKRSDQKFGQIIRMLARHEQILEALPEAIREKIGSEKK